MAPIPVHMRDRLCFPYLLRTGIITSHPPLHLVTRSVPYIMHVACPQSFAGLLHWRHTRLFKPLELANFVLSCDDNLRNVQLEILEKFFLSLPYGAFHINSIRLSLSDSVIPVNLFLLNHVVRSLSRSGCSVLTLHSSEVYAVNILNGEGEGTEFATPQLKELDVESSSLSAVSISPWFLRTLHTSIASLESLHLSFTGITRLQWSELLPTFNFPLLRNIYIEGVGIHALSSSTRRGD